MRTGSTPAEKFQVASALNASVRMPLLPRELLKAKGSETVIRVGHTVAATRLAQSDDQAILTYQRWRTELLAAREDFKVNTRKPLRARLTARGKRPVIAAHSELHAGRNRSAPGRPYARQDGRARGHSCRRRRDPDGGPRDRPSPRDYVPRRRRGRRSRSRPRPLRRATTGAYSCGMTRRAKSTGLIG